MYPAAKEESAQCGTMCAGGGDIEGHDGAYVLKLRMRTMGKILKLIKVPRLVYVPSIYAGDDTSHR